MYENNFQTQGKNNVWHITKQCCVLPHPESCNLLSNMIDIEIKSIIPYLVTFDHVAIAHSLLPKTHGTVTHCNQLDLEVARY